jgi:surface antigen
MASSDGANVRDSQLDSPALFAQAGGVHGTVIAGPRTGSAANFTGNWWQIEWDSEPPAQNGNNGWTAESVILLAPTAGDVPEPVLTSSYYTTQNAFFPTFAPSVIGGSLGSLGNCTWYAYGRMLERGYSQSLLNDFALHNADTWATDASGVVGVTVDTTPTVDSIAELDSGSFSTLGHVAVVESVNSDGTVTVTESSDKADITSVWDFTWHHRTVAASWFSHFIHVTKNSGGGSAPVISNPVLTGTTFSISVPTQTGTNYVLEYKNSMSDVNWTPIETNGGNGAAISLIDTQTPSASRFYRVRLK